MYVFECIKQWQFEMLGVIYMAPFSTKTQKTFYTFWPSVHMSPEKWSQSISIAPRWLEAVQVINPALSM